MRPRTLVVLSVVVAALLAFIWFFERDLPSTDERAEMEKRVLSLESEEVTAVVIERGGDRVRLVREAPAAEAAEGEDGEDGGAEREWRLAEPLAARAEAASVDSLVDALAALERERVLDEVDREAVGLAEPRAMVTVETADGGHESLAIGAEVPASSNMIVERGDEVLVVPRYVFDQLEADADAWRSKEVFPGVRARIERLAVTREEGADLELAKRDEEFWLESPVEDLADADRVDDLLSAISGLGVESFLDEPEVSAAEMGLEPPRAALTVTYSDREAPFRLELGGPAPGEAGERYARAGEQLLVVGDDLDEPLAGGAEGWQSAAWTTLEVFETDSLRIDDGDGEMLLERAGADWNRDGETIPYGPVSDFLYALSGAAGERVLGREEAGELGVDPAAEPQLEITLAGADREETLTLHGEVEGGAVAGLDSRAYLLLLPEATVEDLRIKLQEIRDAEPVGDEPEPDDG